MSHSRLLRGVIAVAVSSLLLAISIVAVTPAAAVGPNANETITTALTPTQLAQSLVGAGVSVSNVTYTGGASSSGSFNFTDPSVLGFGQGVVMGTGNVNDVVGPNTSDSTSTDWALDGDPDLTALATYPTYDAAVLQFDFVPTASQVVFNYVFASDEYSEWVNTQYNDVFAFSVNGVNGALVRQVAGDPTSAFVPVAIDNINNSNPVQNPPPAPMRPDLFRANDYTSAGPSAVDLELDGITTVLTFQSAVNPGVTNHMKLAIADGSDHVWDSAVFIQAGSLVSNENPTADVSLLPKSGAAPLDVVATVEGNDPHNAPLTYSINWGDGTPNSSGALTAETALVPHTFSYGGQFVVTLTVSNGTLSSSSTEDIHVTGATAPTAPNNVVATAMSASQINITWDPVPGATKYTVLRSLTSGGPYTKLATVTAPAYANKGLTPMTAYFYVVTATTPAGSTPNSLEATDSTHALPGAPDNPHVSALSATQISVSWDPVPDATKYSVYMATVPGGPYANAGAVTPPATTRAVKNLTPMTPYYFVVRATTPDGVSPNSAEVTDTTHALPTAPDNVVATATSATQVNVTWDPVPGATKYTVYRAPVSGGPYVPAGSVSGASTSYANKGLTPTTLYFYIVKVVTPDGASLSSAEAAATTHALPPPPDNVLATPTSATQINVTWDPVPGATKYTVYRGTGSGAPFTVAANTGGSTTVATIKGLTPGTAYHFVIRVTTADGVSPNSLEADGTTHALPDAPANVIATAVSASQINITWDSVRGATRYSVYRSMTPGGPYTAVGTVSGSVLTFTSKGLVSETIYYFVVRATTSDGLSVNSAEAFVSTLA